MSDHLWALSRWLYRHRLRPLALLVKAINFGFHSTLLPYQAEVGKNVRVEHHGVGTVIHPNVHIGDDVLIWHGVTLASETQPGSPYRIYIGDRVSIGAGAIIIGRGDQDLVVGPGARVGAGAIVTRNVAAGETVVSPSARPLRP